MFDVNYHRTTVIPRLLERMGPPEDIRCTDGAVKIRDQNSTLTFRIYHPVDPKIEIRDILPTLLYVPATGFNTMICPGWSHIICSHLAKKSGYQTIVLYHRLTPEYPFPAAIADIDSLIRYIIRNGDEFKIDMNNIVLGGYSSGGNVVTAVCEMLARNQISFKALYLISPMLDLSRSISEYRRYEERDRFTEKLAEWMIDLYAQETDRKDELLSPFWSRNSQCLPNIIRLFVGEYDRFRGDVEKFAEKIEKTTGKCVTKFVFENSIHADFWYNICNVEAVIKFLRIDNEKIPREIFAAEHFIPCFRAGL